MKDMTYKLDIRSFKDKGKSLATLINYCCSTFTLMHYNQLVMNPRQFKDLAKSWGLIEIEGTKGILYKTDKGYVMEVVVKDSK